MAARKTRKDKGKVRELTAIAVSCERYAAKFGFDEAVSKAFNRVALEVRMYDQRDRLKKDKEK